MCTDSGALVPAGPAGEQANRRRRLIRKMQVVLRKGRQNSRRVSNGAICSSIPRTARKRRRSPRHLRRTRHLHARGSAPAGRWGRSRRGPAVLPASGRPRGPLGAIRGRVLPPRRLPPLLIGFQAPAGRSLTSLAGRPEQIAASRLISFGTHPGQRLGVVGLDPIRGPDTNRARQFDRNGIRRRDGIGRQVRRQDRQQAKDPPPPGWTRLMRPHGRCR